MPDTGVISRKEREPAEPMKPLVDPAVWVGEEIKDDPSWKFELTPAEAKEVDAAVESVCKSGIEIKDITKEDFPLPTLDARMAAVKEQLMEGYGFALMRGVPVQNYDIKEAAVAFWGLSLRVGEMVSQNYKGHLLGHVSDIVGKDRNLNPTIRAYHTSAELGYHSDSCDVVALMCLHPAKEGGVSTIASTPAIYNTMLERRPDLVEELIKPWYRDRREEIPPGKGPYFELPVFNFAEGYFSCSWQNFYIRSAQRFEELPRFTEAQQEALDMIDTLADELRLNQGFQTGDIQYLHNHVIIHARTEYEDWPEKERMRHLLRFWLATPGGRPLNDQVLERYVGLKPGQRPAGIIVEGMEFQTPLDPE